MRWCANETMDNMTETIVSLEGERREAKGEEDYPVRCSYQHQQYMRSEKIPTKCRRGKFKTTNKLFHGNGRQKGDKTCSIGW